MKILKFYGHSDDTFGEYGVTGLDFDNCANGKPIIFKVSADGKAVFVTGQYSRYGNNTWGIDIAFEDEDSKPDWTMRLSFKDYTTVLEMDVPDGFALEYIGERV